MNYRTRLEAKRDGVYYEKKNGKEYLKDSEDIHHLEFINTLLDQTIALVEALEWIKKDIKFDSKEDAVISKCDEVLLQFNQWLGE